MLLADLKAVGSGIGVSVLCPGRVATRFAQPDAEIPDEAELPAGVLSARGVAAAVRKAMLERRFYVFTHDDTEPLLLDRQQRLLSDLRGEMMVPQPNDRRARFRSGPTAKTSRRTRADPGRNIEANSLQVPSNESLP